ncbi:MAG: hypothetical protein ACXWWD_09435 [Chitinophagaceae bacterium]
MQDLKRIPLPELLDLLVEQTARYSGMIHGRGTLVELQVCRDLMTAIQLEIESRKEKNNPMRGIASPKDQASTGTSN